MPVALQPVTGASTAARRAASSSSRSSNRLWLAIYRTPPLPVPPPAGGGCQKGGPDCTGEQLHVECLGRRVLRRPAVRRGRRANGGSHSQDDGQYLGVPLVTLGTVLVERGEIAEAVSLLDDSSFDAKADSTTVRRP